MIGESFSTALELFICRVEEAVKHQDRAFANSVGVNVLGFFFLLCFVDLGFFAVVGPSAQLSE